MAGAESELRQTRFLWVYENEHIYPRMVTYVPVLYNMFNEILVKAADNKKKRMNFEVKVTINVESNSITVFSTGDVVIPKAGELYDFKFFSELVVETADGNSHKKIKQVYSENKPEPTTISSLECREDDNWTEITFTLAKFSLDIDDVALMNKRVIDIAGCLWKTVKVKLNGKAYPFRSFSEYCRLYMKNPSSNPFVEYVQDDLQICIRPSGEQFKQVSFVNCISTIEGGTHVEYLTNKIGSHLVSEIDDEMIRDIVEPKNHMLVFVNAFIDNATFDSQTKERLTLDAGSFGSSWDLTPNFLDGVANSGIIATIEECAEAKLRQDLKRKKKKKKMEKDESKVLVGKHYEAHQWGKEESQKCTLILTQGSAKTVAEVGLTTVGREHYGVFLLRGKLPNAYEADQIMHNAELTQIMQILGLKTETHYDDTKLLKYGHVMIMTNQDHDGSHFKGFLINLFRKFFPGLLKVRSFLQELITPIVKAKHNDADTRIQFFHTMPEYEAWKEKLGTEAKNWTIDHYPVFGSLTHAEVREYFRFLDIHKRDFVWESDQDGEAIELAFSEEKIEARENWLRQFKLGSFLDHTDRSIKYCDFIYKDLVYCFIEDNQRSIPSMVDGLTQGQRKILFSLFKRKSVFNVISVHDLCCVLGCSECLASTIIGMAQDYVGSNNINLLLPNGHFGSRRQGGKDHEKPRYIRTQLSPLTRFLFPKEDSKFLNEIGKSVEPICYVPIIPLVLVNGSEGVGTVWSSSVPNYDPADIIANIKRLLNGKQIKEMLPWYKGFSGSIVKNTTKDTGASYTIRGNIEKVDQKTFRITELPIRMWTQDYEEFLKSVSADNDPLVQEFYNRSDGEIVHFTVCMSEERISALKEEELLEKLKLTTSVRASNMHLFDSSGVIKKYETPEQILKEFYDVRLGMYKARKDAMLANLAEKKLKCENICRFIDHFGEFEGQDESLTDLVGDLEKLKFDRFPKKENTSEVAVAGLTNEDKESVENSSGYDYLLSLGIVYFTPKRREELNKEKEKLDKEVEELKQTTVESLWISDLDAFQDKYIQGLNNHERECALRKLRHGEEPKEDPENTRTETEEVGEIKKPRGKAAAQKKVTATIDEVDDHIADLRQRKRKRKGKGKGGPDDSESDNADDVDDSN